MRPFEKQQGSGTPDFSPFQFFRNRHLGLSEDQTALQQLQAKTDYLVTEVNGVKETLAMLMSSVRGSLGQLAVRVSALQGVSGPPQKPKKMFVKSLFCPAEGCGKKYSSKIALNCHRRRKHGPK